jgi:Protein of unknown function (DUF2934)
MGTQVSSETRQEMIRKKAYEIYVQRGKAPGREQEDWIQAERAVDREIQAKASTGTSYTVDSPTPAAPIRTSTTPKVGTFKSRV